MCNGPLRPGPGPCCSRRSTKVSQGWDQTSSPFGHEAITTLFPSARTVLIGIHAPMALAIQDGNSSHLR